MRLRHPGRTGPARTIERRARTGRRISVPPMDLPGQEPVDEPAQTQPVEPAAEPSPEFVDELRLGCAGGS
ncbi:hypothetical protein [Nonomuraea dietziae]|uniref:hypothetical protein n=1 Tax=Nonomuraea dietziae TaxID=65515 RepID=UPI003433372F